VTFNFELESPLVDVALKFIRSRIFIEYQIEILPACREHREVVIVHELLECYNVTEEDQEEKYPRNMQVPETAEEWVKEGPELESDAYANPLRLCKVNIDRNEKPKFMNISDY
jgi:hypothetical protein